MTSGSIHVNEMWKNWMKFRDNETANKLMEAYMYLVMYHVQRVAVHLPSSVTLEDLKSLGLYGLYDALQKFDPNRDLKFDTYASFRIRGAIIDGLRKEDWLPRSIRDKANKVKQISGELEQRLQRVPSSKEIGDELDMSSQEVETIVKDTLFSNLLSIEDKGRDNNDDFIKGTAFVVPDETNPTPEKHLIDMENYDELERAIEELNHNEQMILSLFYKEELSLTEIGQVLGLTTSRISQIHKQALFKLRKVLTTEFI